MVASIVDVLPSIRTLPLSDEAQRLFSRAVRIVQQRPGDFAPVAAWLDKHYSETTLRKLYERQYRHGFAYRLSLLRRDSATYNRRLAIERGAKWEQLAWETINEALHRGRRLDGERPGIWQDRRGVTVNESNVHLVWKWEDEQYRRQFREIKAERRAAKLSEHDHPDSPGWRLRRAVGELVEAEYPDGAGHVEHSRKIVALAALLMPEPLPMLGELGAWRFASELDLRAAPTGDWLTDELTADAEAASQGPHGYRPTLLDLRKVGREEVLFVRMPGESRQVQHDFPLDDLLKLLAVAVDELGQVSEVEPTTEPARQVYGAAVARAYLQYAADEPGTQPLGIHTTVVARLWLELAAEYPFWDMRQGQLPAAGEAPAPAPRWMDHFRQPDEAWTWFKEASRLLAERMYAVKPDDAPVLLRIHHYRPPGNSITGATNQDEVRRAIPSVDEMLIRQRVGGEPAAPVKAVAFEVGKAKTSRKKGGRPRLDVREERRRIALVEDWQRAKEAGVVQKDFCADKDITVDRLNKLVNWFTQRQKRKDEGI